MLDAQLLLPLWLIEWTIATQCCMARPLQSYSGYRWYWMLPLVWSLISANTSTLHRCFVTLSTGCTASHCKDTVQDCCSDLQLCPVYLKQVICPVSNLSRRSLRSAGRGDLFVSRAKTSSSASEVSPPQLQSSGTHFHLYNFVTCNLSYTVLKLVRFW